MHISLDSQRGQQASFRGLCANEPNLGEMVMTPVKTGRFSERRLVQATTQPPSRRALAFGVLSFMIVGLSFLLAVVSVEAQPTTGRDADSSRSGSPIPITSPLSPAPLPTAPPAAPVTAPEKFPIPPSIINLPDGKGGVIAVPADANIERFLEWLKQERLKNTQLIEGPTASVTSVEFEGQADDQMATLTGRLTVQIAGNQFPTSYPIGLGEAVFRRKDVQGPGQVFFGGRDR